ncbi:MAG: DUF2000 domain-containing protein [Bdellovibrionales bacterium]|nr:DUF2000 domain-containing protein [Bdellovibrionales bacterium]
MTDLPNLPSEDSKRFIAVLNKKIELGRLLNALGHMAAGIVARVGNTDALCFLEYLDETNGIHPCISHFPFIVLKADNSNKIKKIREEAIARNVPFTDFTETMTIGTSSAQLEATKSVSTESHEYFGICMFGDTDTLREFTGKLSLFR